MRQHYAQEVASAPEEPPLEMVLRYAFGRGASTRAAAGVDIKERDLTIFLRRFGPMRTCLSKASRSDVVRLSAFFVVVRVHNQKDADTRGL